MELSDDHACRTKLTCSTPACTTRRNEHDACGVGFVAHIKGEKSHAIVTRRSRFWKTWTTAARWGPTS
jgi:hypothetical protein